MIVVTGAPGHIGNNLVRGLLSRGLRVRCMALKGESLKPLDGMDVEVVEGDVRDASSLDRAFLGADAVFHLASVISLIPGHMDLLEQVNVRGARNVAEACLRTGVKRLVYTSSIHAFVEPPHGIPIDESATLDPSQVLMAYSKTKAQGTLEVLDVAAKGLDVVVMFPTGVIGPYDYKPSEFGQMILDYSRGKLPVRIRGGYDFVDVRDVAEGHIQALLKGPPGSKYILHGEWISVDDIMKEISFATGRPVPRLCLPPGLARFAAGAVTAYSARTGKKPPFNADSFNTLQGNSLVRTEKAEKELGFSPRPISRSIRDSVEWFIQAGMLRIGATSRSKKPV